MKMLCPQSHTLQEKGTFHYWERLLLTDLLKALKMNFDF